MTVIVMVPYSTSIAIALYEPGLFSGLLVSVTVPY